MRRPSAPVCSTPVLPDVPATLSTPPTAMYHVSLADIQSARARIASYVRRTPLARSETLSRRLGTNVYLKAKVLQKTGSFKVRGALDKKCSTWATLP